jgi:hypothetical protein
LSLLLRLDLKPTIKRFPLRVVKEGGERSKTPKQRVCRLPPEKIGGGNAVGITSGSLLHPPFGVSINTLVKISTISISISMIHFIPLIV